jgi:transcriptional regulator with XRE-family HTH domain
MFNKTLKRLIDDNNVRLDDLANYIGKSRPTISHYISGEASPNIEVFAKIADFFGISLDELCGRKKIELGESQALLEKNLVKIESIYNEIEQIEFIVKKIKKLL